MGLILLIFLLLVVMPGLLYLVGFGVNLYLQKGLGRTARDDKRET